MRHVFVVHVQLDGTEPLVWRRLEISADASFWDLHCAIQDAMPWEDHHLHEFRFAAGDVDQRIGIPDGEEFEEAPPLPGWKTRVADWLVRPTDHCVYHYDFGDDWLHTVTLESIRPAVQRERLPRCTGGAHSCPPEDVGGLHGYEQLLAAMANPKHREHRSYKEWLGGTWPRPEFDPAKVVFTDPKRRLRLLGLR